MKAMQVDKTSLLMTDNNSSLTLEKKITVIVVLYNDNKLSTNQTTSLFLNKELLPEKKIFIKVFKVIRFFAILFNFKIKGDII